MKRIAVAAAVLAGLCLSPFALAQADKPIKPATMSCGDFLAVEDTYKPALVYWVSGADKLGVQETVTTVVDTATPVAAIVGECERTPKASFASKVRDLYKAGRIALFSHT
ncbi:HdeA/HdeB family chaperone [Paraburkholderia strydomiana]|uniref:HdeA/HdeB family chaperone n=1 Tax=Paraburkholderia strydomiana TaxID=1245417 RepID=UPI002865779F|nr:HdeA/HdeB family chaperone [Paraburkholderia strydomiana]MDR7006193.1 acid stress chaperone HdeA [Paraburkholderia strydomiana]MDR7006206.1 acid stress chaperone HdeA [Paraburkholderia strydomiana]